MNSLLILAVISVAVLLSPDSAFAAKCERAQDLLEESVESGKQQDWAGAYEHARESINLCPRFENWYLIGQVLQEKGSYREAASAFADARSYAETETQVAIAISRYAESVFRLGHAHQAAALLHHARSLHSDVPDWVNQLAKKTDLEIAKAPLEKSEVTRALGSAAYRSLKINAKPSVNIRINFKVDSTELVNGIAFDPAVLAEVLSEPEFRNVDVQILGHTDTTGEEEYNNDLSEQRAKVIYDQLVAVNPELKTRLSTKGMGESKPLYSEKDDTERMLNRRIELQVN